MTESTGVPAVDVTRLVQVGRRRWKAIIACVLVGGIGAFAMSTTAPKTYRSSSRLFVSIPAARGVQEALQGVQLSSQLLASYTRIAGSRAVAEGASERLEGQFTAGEIRAKVTAKPEPETLLVDISATDTDPISARDIANAVSAELIEKIAELEAGKAGAVEARVIDEATTPSTPVSPRPRSDTVLGILLGLAIGAGLALILEASDKSLSTPAQASAAFGTSVLASVPRHRRNAEDLVALDGSSSPAGEAYRSLRTAVRFIDATAGSTVKTLLVTSPSAGEGKTSTAANLAVAFASSGERVVLIDADLRRPRIAALFDLDAESEGLTSVVFDRLDVAEVLQRYRDRLDVVTTGPLPTNPSEVLGSEAMVSLLDEAAAMADIVIIDAPPLLPVTDAAVLSALVDGVVVVAQWAKTTTLDAEDAAMTLRGVGANIVGVVMNGVRGPRGRRYDGGYAAKPSPVPLAAMRSRRRAG